MDKTWLESYPPGVPAEVHPAPGRTLIDVLEEACTEFATRPAFDNLGAVLDFAGLERASRAFAAYLQHDCGLAVGERVALMMPNMLAYPVALAGVLRAGGVVVNVNPLYTAPELAHQLADAGARRLVVFENALPTLARAGAELTLDQVVVTRLGDCMPWPKRWLVDFLARRRAHGDLALPPGALRFDAALARGRKRPYARPRLDGGALAFLQYTGGTTGRAKGAMLSHRNIVANVAQVTAWFDAHTARGEEIMITALPLYHVYALTANCLATLVRGGCNCLITDPRDLDRFVDELQRVPFTGITGVNTLFSALLEHPRFAEIDFSHLKFTNAGGMAVQRAVAERWHGVTGNPIAEGYGLTEASPVVTVNRFDVARFTGSIGLPVPSTDIRILAEDGSDAAPGDAGELLVRGPQVMQGYWNRPEETAAVLDADGWLHTGDVARIDDAGYLYLVDRKKDLIIVSGFNVYPNEIEDVVAHHPGVREVAAIGVPDPHSDEAVRLVVVRGDPALDAATLIAWCRERLTGYKVPRGVSFADALPKTPVGKILKRELRERYGDAG
ncbi:MAG: AMP-binding protein [Gammaproteobacteria bacterium]|nr:AMP-binding protein [Gammaproteobacteria bacterium]